MSKFAVAKVGAAVAVVVGVILAMCRSSKSIATGADSVVASPDALPSVDPPAALSPARPAEPQSAVRPPSNPVSAPRTRRRSEAGHDAPLGETAFLTRLHALAASDPTESLRLARLALASFPTSPNAPEFEWNVVKALFNMGRFEEAKEEARILLQKYPETDFAGDVDRHLLHAPPNPQ